MVSYQTQLPSIVGTVRPAKFCCPDSYRSSSVCDRHPLIDRLRFHTVQWNGRTPEVRTRRLKGSRSSHRSVSVFTGWFCPLRDWILLSARAVDRARTLQFGSERSTWISLSGYADIDHISTTLRTRCRLMLGLYPVAAIATFVRFHRRLLVSGIGVSVSVRHTPNYDLKTNITHP